MFNIRADKLFCSMTKSCLMHGNHEARLRPVRLLCLIYMFLFAFFGLDRFKTFNTIPIILNLLTSRNVALIYLVTI